MRRVHFLREFIIDSKINFFFFSLSPAQQSSSQPKRVGEVDEVRAGVSPLGRGSVRGGVTRTSPGGSPPPFHAPAAGSWLGLPSAWHP